MGRTKEIVNGDSKNFVNKAASADKKPVKKNAGGKKFNKAPSSDDSKKTSNSEHGETTTQKPTVKKPLSRAQIAEKKFGVESTWRPFEAFFNKDKKETK